MSIAIAAHRCLKFRRALDRGANDFFHALGDQPVPRQRGFETHVGRPVDRRSQGKRIDRAVAQIETTAQRDQFSRSQHPGNLHPWIPVGSQRVLELPMRDQWRRRRQRKWMLDRHLKVSLNDTFHQIKRKSWRNPLDDCLRFMLFGGWHFAIFSGSFRFGHYLFRIALIWFCQTTWICLGGQCRFPIECQFGEAGDDFGMVL